MPLTLIGDYLNVCAKLQGLSTICPTFFHRLMGNLIYSKSTS